MVNVSEVCLNLTYSHSKFILYYILDDFDIQEQNYITKYIGGNLDFPIILLWISWIIFKLQEYVQSKQANQVRSLMYMIDMLMHDALAKEDASDNKHIRNWVMVCCIIVRQQKL